MGQWGGSLFAVPDPEANMRNMVMKYAIACQSSWISWYYCYPCRTNQSNSAKDHEMQELLGILCNEKTEGLSLERAKIFGKVWRNCLPEDLSDEKTRGLLRSKTWLDMLDGLRGDILSVLTSVGKRTSRLATHKEVMLEDDSHVPVTSIVDSKMQKAWIKTVRDDIIKACAVLEEN